MPLAACCEAETVTVGAEGVAPGPAGLVIVAVLSIASPAPATWETVALNTMTHEALAASEMPERRS